MAPPVWIAYGPMLEMPDEHLAHSARWGRGVFMMIYMSLF